jgi:nucleoside-diphosphate-sugar epimerase
MKVLLTGASGFLGNYILNNSIQDLDYILYNRNNPNSCNWKEINGVIHCAGLAHHSHNSNLYDKYYKANVELTKSLISNFKDSQAKFFIFISTATVYENVENVNSVTESDNGFNLSVYADSKLQAEREVLMVKEKKVFILRPSVIAGPNSKGNLKRLKSLIESNLPIPVPKKSSKNNLTDIRNLHHVIEYMCLNFKEIESGIFNVNDDTKPNFVELLKKIGATENKNVRLLLIPNSIFKLFLILLKLIRPSLSRKLNQLFFEEVNISNAKIKSYTNLPYNSLE